MIQAYITITTSAASRAGWVSAPMEVHACLLAA